MILTISDVNRLLVQTSSASIKNTEVEGEVSSITEAKSGHAYITLKDTTVNSKKDGYLVVTIWAANYRTKLQVGDTVIISDLSFNSWEGRYSINVNHYYKIASTKQTDKELAEEQFNRLKDEGVFNKKEWVDVTKAKSIAIITSPTGAVIQDILSTIKRRGHTFKAYLYPAVMQGINSPASVIEQLTLAEKNNPDVIIIARGGGSKEDLACFNDLTLTQRVSESAIPIISAIGHETDYCFVDYASNIRAATPTAAAELVTTQGYTYHLDLLDKLESQLNNQVSILKRNMGELELLLQEAIEDSIQELDTLTLKLNAVDITKILDLDYCLLIDRDGKIIDNSQSLQDLDYFQIIRKNEEATIGI
jgi:exodeoxyribonuclease VII large subunit